MALVAATVVASVAWSSSCAVVAEGVGFTFVSRSPLDLFGGTEVGNTIAVHALPSAAAAADVDRGDCRTQDVGREGRGGYHGRRTGVVARPDTECLMASEVAALPPLYVWGEDKGARMNDSTAVLVASRSLAYRFVLHKWYLRVFSVFFLL